MGKGREEGAIVTDRDHIQLLFGPYKAPPLRRGDRAFCLCRDAPVYVIRISDAPIPWPVCLPLERPRCGRGLLVDEELARAIRNESAAAVAHWWGVNHCTVARWRRLLGVTKTNNEGTHRLVLGAIQASLESRFGGATGQGVSPYPARGRAAVWSAEEIALLGALPDAEVARRTGRSLPAVNKKRLGLGRPAVTAEGGARSERFWRPEEDEAVLALPPGEAARRTGRSLRAVHHRRSVLGIAGTST
jgi:hypothetical protein